MKTKRFDGGGRLLIASEQMHLSAQQIIPSYNNIANCIRARAALNATDNSLMEDGMY